MNIYTDLPERPYRRMPSLDEIARFHGKERDRCWTCSAETEYLERAHIIDRAHDGLDGAQNLAIACVLCNRYAPVFPPEDVEWALAWYGLPGKRSMCNSDDVKRFIPYMNKILKRCGVEPIPE